MAGTELGKAWVQIVPSAKGISGSISKVLGAEADSAGRNTGLNIAGKIKKVIAAAGIGTALWKTLDEGGKLQQSYIGGLDTIYGEAADKAREYARAAVQAGVSQNDFAEQAVSFGAALRQAYGGDTQKAMEAANTAILDMTDNAAKMGTPLQSIQDAYQGFAKQNYTMLDNLKLGYGGTKTEMERLLADAEKISGVHYDISNLGDVYDAIHAIQGDLGLTGVAAAEASETFSGSMNAMKAAAQNLMGNLMLGEGVSTSMQDLVKTTTTFLAGNLLPAVGRVFAALPEAIRTAISIGASLISDMGIDLSAITAKIDEMLPSLIDKGLKIAENLSAGIRSKVGDLVSAGLEIIEHIAQGIADAIPSLVEHIPTIITNISGIINDNAPKIITTGVKIIVTLTKGIIQAIPTIVSNLPKIIEAIWNAFTAVNWISLGRSLITSIASGIRGAAAELPSTLKGIGTKAWNALGKLNWKTLGSAIIKAVGTGITSLINLPSQILKRAGSLAMKAFTSISWGTVGRNVVQGIVRGVTAAASLLTNTLKNLAKKALEAAKNALGIKSPSRVFRDEVGRNIALGLAAGIKNNLRAVESATAEMAGATLINPQFGEFESRRLSSAAVNIPRSEGTSTGTTNNTFYITVDGAKDPETWMKKFVRDFGLETRTT